jgi:O-antigen ligase
MGIDEFMGCLRVVGRIFAICLIIEMIVLSGDFYDAFIGNIDHPMSLWNAAGVNGEGSYFCFFVALEIGTAYFWPMVMLALAYGAGAASRTTELGALMCITALIWSRLTPQQRKTSLIAIAVAGAVVVAVVINYFSEVGVVQRILEIGSQADPGTVGRFILWFAALEAFIAYPFGYGLGMAATFAASVSPLWGGENNVHNIYLQFAVDGGIQTLIAYLAIVFVVWRNFIAWSNWRLPLGLACVIYQLFGLEELRGYDTLPFLLIGALTILTRREILEWLVNQRRLERA